MTTTRNNFIRRTIAVFMAVFMVFGLLAAFSTTVYASDNITVTINGVPVVFADQQPVVVDGRTLVPIREVFEALGFEVTWEPAFQMATLINGEFRLAISIGYHAFMAAPLSAPQITRHHSVPLDVPAQLINDRTMLPIRSPLEAVGYEVGWDNATRTVVIQGGNGYGGGNLSATTQVTQQPVMPIETAPPFQVEQPSTTTTATSPTNPTNPSFSSQPVLLSSAELIVLAENAPSWIETRSNIILPDRRITDAELQAWIEEYHALGGINAFELEVIRLINELRVGYGLQPLAINIELSMASRFHSQETIDRNRRITHISPHHGHSSYRAMDMFGHITAVQENMSGSVNGNSSPQQVVEGWLNSPGHRVTMLNPARDNVGIGRVGGVTTAKFSAVAYATPR